jgi:hypothetical protein
MSEFTIPPDKLQEWKEQSKKTIDEIYEIYKNDPYMISKTNHYITRQLPFILENIKQNHISSQQRIEELSYEQEQFIFSFLNRNRYFHVANTEKYFIYDGLHYTETNEDHMLYIILTSIRNEQNPKLLSWKDKTKVSLLKRIKETHLTQTIPESQTIQMVFQLLCPAIFQNKKECKYFLSILGDNIFRKNSLLFHFISPNMKSFLRECNQIALSCFGTQCTQTFKTKCHDKHYMNENSGCRLVRIQEGCKSEYLSTLIPYILDILCVACHYSVRYINSDFYIIDSCSDIEIIDYVFRLTYTSPEILIDNFISEYLFVVDNTTDTDTDTKDKDTKMNWQTMLYLWKQYLHTKQLPLTLYQSILKPIVTQTRFSEYYNSDGDFFVGIGSSQWPMIQTFLRYWNETMVYDENEMELEIEEITNLFRLWGETVRTYKWEVFSLTEYQILDVISYFFPDIQIDKQKYIYNIRSLLWDKRTDIQTAFIQYKFNIYDNIRKTPVIISIYDIYSFYCRFYSAKSSSSSSSSSSASSSSSQSKVLLVSKSYFEKYIMEKYGEYICENGILTNDWLDVL